MNIFCSLNDLYLIVLTNIIESEPAGGAKFEVKWPEERHASGHC